MDAIGVNWFLFVAQLINLLLLIGLLAWAPLAIITLVQLARRPLAPALQLGWVALVLLVPVLGALAFLIVQPGRPRA